MYDRCSSTIPALALGAVLVTSLASQSAAETLRYNRWFSPSHFINADIIAGWGKQIAKVTNGRVKMEMTASSLGAPPRQYQLAVDGIADLTWNGHGYTPGRFPLTEFVELAFLGNSAEAISVAYWRTYNKFLVNKGEHKQVKVLGLHTHTPGHVYNNKRPITAIAHFGGLKIRANNPTTASFLKSVGAIPQFMPVTQLRDALSKGILDGTVFTDEAFVNFRMEKHIKFALHVPGGMYNTSFFFVMNKKKWDALSPEDQKAIEGVSGENFSREAGKIWDQQAVSGTKKLKQIGVKFNQAEGALLASIRKNAAPLEKKWIEKAKSRGVDGAMILSHFREEIKNYKPQQ